MMFKYLLIVLIGYWVFKRVTRVADAVKRDGRPPEDKHPNSNKKKNTNIDHSKGGEYVDYEEVE